MGINELRRLNIERVERIQREELSQRTINVVSSSVLSWTQRDLAQNQVSTRAKDERCTR